MGGLENSRKFNKYGARIIEEAGNILKFNILEVGITGIIHIFIPLA